MAAQCVTLAPLSKSSPVGGADPAPEPLCQCSVLATACWQMQEPCLRDWGVHIYIYTHTCMGFYVFGYIFSGEKWAFAVVGEEQASSLRG